jgi:hypothetical protein
VRREGLGVCRTGEEGELRGEGVRRARREGLEGARAARTGEEGELRGGRGGKVGECGAVKKGVL